MSVVTSRKIKTAMIRARTEPDLKHEAEKILSMLGLNPTQAITLFYRQITIHQGLPFQVKVPNKKTLTVFKNTDMKKDIKKASSAEDLFEKLGI